MCSLHTHPSHTPTPDGIGDATNITEQSNVKVCSRFNNPQFIDFFGKGYLCHSFVSRQKEKTTQGRYICSHALLSDITVTDLYDRGIKDQNEVSDAIAFAYNHNVVLICSDNTGLNVFTS